MIYLGCLVAILVLIFPVIGALVGVVLGVKTRLWGEVAVWYFKATGLFLLGLPVVVLGWPIVALALRFRVEHTETSKPFTEHPEWNWQLVTLPWLFKLWSNEMDGAWGDKRGWWDNECRTKDGQPCTAFLSMWKWLACRNPANYWSRVITGCDLGPCKITKLAGDDVVLELPGFSQWQFLVATKPNGTRYHRFFCSLPWFFNAEHCVMIDIGWKIKLAHNGIGMDAPVADRIRGSVFTPSFWKAL